MHTAKELISNFSRKSYAFKSVYNLSLSATLLTAAITGPLENANLVKFLTKLCWHFS